MVTSKPLMPKLSKISPISGFKRMFSLNAVVELIKSIAKIGIIGLVSYNYLKDKAEVIFILYDMPLMQAIALAGDMVIGLGIQIAVIYMILALSDWE